MNYNFSHNSIVYSRGNFSRRFSMTIEFLLPALLLESPGMLLRPSAGRRAKAQRVRQGRDEWRNLFGQKGLCVCGRPPCRPT